MCALLCTAVFLSFEHQLCIYWYIAHLTETKPKVKEINIYFQKKSIENQFSLIFFLIYFHEKIKAPILVSTAFLEIQFNSTIRE